MHTINQLIIVITARLMNKNRNSIDDKRIIPEKPSNINIQINFNMKDKPTGFSGKKIDNYVEIDQKPVPRTQNLHKHEDVKKYKKKTIETGERDKEKVYDTPKKFRQTDRNRTMNNQLHQKTPERKSTEKKERSKSTNQKLLKRKNAKSMQNIKSGIKINRIKAITPSSSGEKSKSRSRSKSSNKIAKSNEISLKNLFANSGIKSKIKKTNHQSRQKLTYAVGKKPTQDQIKRFMEEKKKKEKRQKIKQNKEQKSKKQRLTQQLRKVESQRKANASKSFVAQKQLYNKDQRLPIYHFEDEQFDEESQYDHLKEEAKRLIRDSPSPKNTIETISIAKVKDYQRQHSSSGKKILKKKNNVVLVHKYLNGTINQRQFFELNKKIIKIQSVWRGYYARKMFAKRLNDEAVRIRYQRNRIQNKRGNFWAEQQNSIVNIQKDSHIQIYDSSEPERQKSNIIYYNSNVISNVSHNSIISNNNSNPSSKNDKFKKLSIQIIDDDNDKDLEQPVENTKMHKEIQELRKMLEQQSQKYRSLEEQNQNLKENIKNLSLKESKEISKDQVINSIDLIEIRMPKKIQNVETNIQPINKLQLTNIDINFSSNESNEKQKPIPSLNSYKKQFQSFECSSPSNAKLQQQLKSLKNKNIKGLFKKKQIKIEEKYEKKNEMFGKMLEDRIFSPRTYNVRIKQLQLKLRQQKQQIEKRRQQALRVVGFIGDISESQDDSNKQDDSLRIATIGIKEVVRPSFKKQKETSSQRHLIDTFTNTSPLQIKPIEFKPPLRIKNISKEQIINNQNNSNSQFSSEEEQIYKKYWTDDIEEVHRHTLQITKKIDEAMKAQNYQEKGFKIESDGSAQYQSGNNQYNSQGHPFNEKEEERDKDYKRGHKQSKSDDFQANLSSLRQSYEDCLKEIPVLPSERKAREIFNKIDLSDENECNSQGQMQNSNDNICKLLNSRPVHTSPNNQVKQVQNLYISQSEFNKKKRKQEQLSRSSSFDKSNKSLSANNSQVQMKGFITNLTFIKEFCISVCEYIRVTDTFRQHFIEHISKPIKYDMVEYLKSYRKTLNEELKNNYNTYMDQYLYHYFKSISAKQQTISGQLFNTFMKVYEEEKINSPRWNDPSMNKKIKQMREYFLVSIIDAFNESLEYEKPGSIYGQPFPWLNNSKRLKNCAHTQLKYQNLNKDYNNEFGDQEQPTQQQKIIDQIFGSSIAKIIQWGSCLCGFIADPMPMQMGDSQIANLSQEQLTSIRQNRVGLMLEKWLLEEQEKITNSTAEFTQVMLCLGEKIIETLLLQCSEQLSEIQFFG